MTPADLAAIKARVEAQAPLSARFLTSGYAWDHDDAEQVAALVTTDVPALVAEVERLRVALASLKTDEIAHPDPCPHQCRECERNEEIDKALRGEG